MFLLEQNPLTMLRLTRNKSLKSKNVDGLWLQVRWPTKDEKI